MGAPIQSKSGTTGLFEGNGIMVAALGSKTITENDTYDASDDDLNGYSSVTVNVPIPELDATIAVGSGDPSAMTAGADMTYTFTATADIASGTVITVALAEPSDDAS